MYLKNQTIDCKEGKTQKLVWCDVTEAFLNLILPLYVNMSFLFINKASTATDSVSRLVRNSFILKEKIF